MSLPAGKKSLRQIARMSDAADRVADTTTLLEYALGRLKGEGGGVLPGTLRERVDRHRDVFTSAGPAPREVHEAISVRNALVHDVEPGHEAKVPSAKDVRGAASTLELAVRAVAARMPASERGAVLGGRDFGPLLALVAFLGTWQIVYFAARMALPANWSGEALSDAAIVLVLLVPVHRYLLPLVARGVRRLDATLAYGVSLFAAAVLPLARLVLEVLPARSLRKTLEPVAEGLGTGVESLAQVLGEGVYALVPWTMILREGVWSRVEARSWLPALVVAYPLIVAALWVFAFRGPRRRLARVPCVCGSRLQVVILVVFAVALVGLRLLELRR